MSRTYTRQEFVDKYGAFIFKQVKGTGILPETLIGQAILESQGKDSSGNWVVGGSKLSRNSNNYFGIKAGSSWNGKTYNINTGEYLKGRHVIVNANFRAYRSVKESIKDYIDFLKDNPRYAKALKQKDYYNQAKVLQLSGYATAPNYAEMIKGIVEPLKIEIEVEKKKYKTIKYVKTSMYSVAMLGLLLLTIKSTKK